MTVAPPRSQEDAGKKIPGWKLVLDALIGAPDRTLTNADLGALRGVQAFHQRLSDLKRRGWVLTPARRVARGYYAYKLIGFMADSDAESDASGYPPSVTAMPEALAVFHDEGKAEDAVSAARISVPEPRRPRGQVNPAITSAIAQAEAGARHRLAAALGGANSPDDDLVILAIAAAARLEADAARRAPRASGPTGPRLMRKALEHYGDPCHTSVIARWVLENGGADVYHGKTPAATMAAQLATSNKTGGEFEKVAPGCYALREWTEEAKAMDPVRA